MSPKKSRGGPRKESLGFVKRPAPEDFQKRYTGPPKEAGVNRPTQLSLETADETSILMGIFFVVYQNVQPDYKTMEKVCLLLNKDHGFHYALTDSGFEHAFRDWRIYAQKIIDTIGGPEVAILNGCRPKSDRQLARLKKADKLDPTFEVPKKVNVPKVDEACYDDELEITDSQPVKERQFALAHEAAQLDNAEIEATTAEPAEEPTTYPSNEATKTDVAKPAKKQTKKRKRTGVTAHKDQPVQGTAAQDNLVVTPPGSPEKLANLHGSDGISASHHDTQPSQAPAYLLEKPDIEAAQTLCQIANHVEAAQTLLLLSKSTEDSQSASLQPAKKIRRTGIAVKELINEPAKVAAQKQQQVVNRGFVPEKEAPPKKQSVPRKNAASIVNANRAATFVPPSGNTSETVTDWAGKTKKGPPSWLPLEMRQLFMEGAKPDAEAQTPLSTKKIDEPGDREMIAWKDTYETAKEMAKPNDQDSDLKTPILTDVYVNTFADLGREVTIPEETSPIPSFGRAPHITKASISDLHPTHNVQDKHVVKDVANQCIDRLEPQVRRIEARTEKSHLEYMKKRNEEVYDLEGKMQKITAVLNHCNVECAEECNGKENIRKSCEAEAEKFAPGGEYHDLHAQPNPNFGREIVRVKQPLLVTMPWDEEKKNNKKSAGKGKAADDEQSAEKGEDGAAEGPKPKRQRKMVAEGAGQDAPKPKPQRKLEGKKMTRTSEVGDKARLAKKMIQESGFIDSETQDGNVRNNVVEAPKMPQLGDKNAVVKTAAADRPRRQLAPASTATIVDLTGDDSDESYEEDVFINMEDEDEDDY
ncbi:MAG: hypothetical protein Q9225_002501 [Loekoesia sp. 1 TL-2023]